jgi:hypothetical protein
VVGPSGARTALPGAAAHKPPPALYTSPHGAALLADSARAVCLAAYGEPWQRYMMSGAIAAGGAARSSTAGVHPDRNAAASV